MDRCRYPSKPCLNARAVKLNGELHRFCEQHRRQANQNQMRWSKRKQTVVRGRRGDGDDGDHDDDDHGAAHGGSSDGGDHTPLGNGGSDTGVPQHGYPGRHPLHLPPPPPSTAHMGMPHGMHSNVNAAGASLSHLSLTNNHPHGHPHGHPSMGSHPHPHPHPHGHPHAHAHHHTHAQAANGGLISSFQDHMARGGAIPGTNGVNLVLGSGGVRRELAPAPLPSNHRAGGGGGGHVPPIQTALPPLLPPRTAVEQPDPSAVHALLMLEHAATIVSSNPSSSQPIPKQEPGVGVSTVQDDDAHVRRELKRAKSNEWIARPTLSPAGLPTVASLASHPTASTTSSSASSTQAAAAAAAAPSNNATVASIGRSASWQPPPTVREDPRESLGQWMQRKQASLPSLSNITRIEKRPYDSISSAAPAATNFHHRGPETTGGNSSSTSITYGNGPTASQHRGPFHAPLHPVPTTKANGASSASSSDLTNDGTKRSAFV